MRSLRLGILSDLHRTATVGESAAWHNFDGHRARVEPARQRTSSAQAAISRVQQSIAALR